MATAVSDADPDVPAQRETVAARILRIVAKAPVNILLIIVAALVARADDRALRSPR